MNIEYKDNFKNSFYEVFARQRKINNDKLLIICDKNTLKYVDKFRDFLDENDIYHRVLLLNSEHLIPDEEAVNMILDNVKDSTYIFAIGSGTLNDLAKFVSFQKNIKCGVLPTAPSMDGYTSTVAAITEKGIKKTYSVNPVSDVLIDIDILLNSPPIMIASGVGDMIGKYTSLMDWFLAKELNDEYNNTEEYVEEAALLMKEALDEAINSLDLIKENNYFGMKSLINSLLTSGKAMQICGSSRPASGSEHHMSHYLEMKEEGSSLLHGLKVGLNTLISLELYNYYLPFATNPSIIEKIKQLPKVEDVREMLKKVNCYSRYQETGISKSLMKEMILYSYKLRDRFTILTLLTKLNKLSDIVDSVVNKIY